MSTGGRSRALEIVTAIMLGVVSLATAAGALQSLAWSLEADEFERDSTDARGVSITKSVTADYGLRIDSDAAANAVMFAVLQEQATDEVQRLYYTTRITAELTRTTPGFADGWLEWQAEGFPDDSGPLTDPDYLVRLNGASASYANASLVMAEFTETMEAKAKTLSQAALIHALALFLLGIAGVNRQQSVRVAVVGLGILAFLAAIALTVTAY